jgi:hypothetical protein
LTGPDNRFRNKNENIIESQATLKLLPASGKTYIANKVRVTYVANDLEASHCPDVRNLPELHELLKAHGFTGCGKPNPEGGGGFNPRIKPKNQCGL